MVTRRKMSMLRRLLRYLGRMQRSGRWVHLSDIYVGLDAEWYGDKAAVRGLLNRHTKRGKRLFLRRKRGFGFYKLSYRGTVAAAV